MSETNAKIRVLVVDDSAFARRVTRQVLERAPDIEVLEIARDGIDALEKIALLSPDVVTLDLMMPSLDGLAVLDALPPEGGPRVVVVSSAGADTSIGAAALAAGAIDLVEKPTTHANDRLYEMASELVDRVRLAAKARASYVRAGPRIATASAARPPARLDAILIGTSTGGPQALTRILSALPADLGAPVLVVVHMPVGYTEALAHRLDGVCALSVLQAHDGMPITAQMVVLAPSGAHLGLARDATGLRARLDYRRTPEQLHQPSVDALFTSAAAVLGDRALGVVLTGMGNDGLAGAAALRAAGAAILAEDERSCIVYGMPRAVVDAGLADEVCLLEHIAERIGARV